MTSTSPTRMLFQEHVPPMGVRTTYSNQSWRSLLQVTVVLCGIAAFTAIPKPGGTNGVMFGIAAASAGLFALVTWQRWRYCARPDNWLLRDTEEGLYLNLRSDQGPAGARPYPTVLFLPRAIILGVGQTMETREMYERRGPEKHNFLCIDLETTGLDVDGLRGLLRAERRAGHNPGGINVQGTRGFPVRVVDEKTLRLVWDRIVPSENTALKQLQQHYPKRKGARVHLPSFEYASAAEREAMIAEAWESGYVEQAARMVRIHHNLPEKKALAWLEERFEEA